MAIDKISNPAFSTLAAEKKPFNGVKPNLSTAATVRAPEAEGFVPDGRPVVHQASVSNRNTQAPETPGGRPVPEAKPELSTAAQAPREYAPGGRPVVEQPSLDSFIYSRTAASKKI